MMDKRIAKLRREEQKLAAAEMCTVAFGNWSKWLDSTDCGPWIMWCVHYPGMKIGGESDRNMIVMFYPN